MEGQYRPRLCPFTHAWPLPMLLRSIARLPSPAGVSKLACSTLSCTALLKLKTILQLKTGIYVQDFTGIARGLYYSNCYSRYLVIGPDRLHKQDTLLSFDRLVIFREIKYQMALFYSIVRVASKTYVMIFTENCSENKRASSSSTDLLSKSTRSSNM